MNTIPTEEEFLKSKGLGGYQQFQGVLKEFARLHATEALKRAWKEFEDGVDEDMEEVMLNAYSLDNIN